MDDLKVGDWNIPAAELDERFETSGGPGGQHANRNETAVRLRWRIDQSSLPLDIKQQLIRTLGENVEVIAVDTRSQSRNREIARQRLIEKIEAALVVEKPRKKSKPTRASKKRRLDSKKARSQTKKDRRRPSLED